MLLVDEDGRDAAPLALPWKVVLIGLLGCGGGGRVRWCGGADGRSRWGEGQWISIGRYRDEALMLYSQQTGTSGLRACM